MSNPPRPSANPPDEVPAEGVSVAGWTAGRPIYGPRRPTYGRVPTEGAGAVGPQPQVPPRTGAWDVPPPTGAWGVPPPGTWQSTAPADAPLGQGAQRTSAARGQPQPSGGLIPAATPPSHQYAPWRRRLGAYGIDCAPILVCGLLLTIAYVLFVIAAVQAPAQAADPPSIVVTLLLIAGTIGVPSLPWTVYNRWVRGGRTGQSVGRRALGLTLLSEQTLSPIGPLNAMCRDILHLLDAATCVGCLWPLWDDKRQTFADMLMRTIVLVDRGQDVRR